MPAADSPWHDAATLRRLYWDRGLSLDDIADRLGCSDVTVLNWMEKHGIQRRTEKRNRLPRPLTVTSPGSTNQGYELIWHDDHCVRHHRLLAVAEHGFDAVREREVHHRNGVYWDNRPSNLELVDPSEHGRIHAPDSDGSQQEPSTDRATTVCPGCDETFLSAGSHWRQTDCEPPQPSTRTRELIDGLILGDGHIQFPSACRPGYLQVRMTNRPFVEWLDRQLGPLSAGARRHREATESRRAVYSVRTRSIDWFDRYREWYADGLTVLPPGYSITALAAKIWFVSDGCLSWGNTPSLRIYCQDYVDRTPSRVQRLLTEHGFTPSLEPYGLCIAPAEHDSFLNWIGAAPPGFSYKWETESKKRYRRLRP